MVIPITPPFVGFTHFNHCSKLNKTISTALSHSLDTYDTTQPILLPLWITILALAFLINLIHLIFLIKKFKLSIQSRKRYLFEINRCLADLFTTGSVTMMLILQSTIFDRNPRARFDDTMRTLLALICSSILATWTLPFTYTAAVVEQYLAIAHPILYRSHVTFRRCLLLIGIDWLVALIIATGSGLILIIDKCRNCTDAVIGTQLTLLAIIIPSTFVTFGLTFRALKKMKNRSINSQKEHRKRIFILSYRMIAFALSSLPSLIMLIVYRRTLSDILRLVKIDTYCSMESEILESMTKDNYLCFLLYLWVSWFIWCLRAIIDPMVACVSDLRGVRIAN